MPMFETVDQVFSALFIWLLGFMLAESVRKSFHLNFKITHLLYIWHTLFCLLYIFYSQTHTADAVEYYYDAVNEPIHFAIGTRFIVFLSGIFVQTLHLSYLGIFLIFNIFGYLGLLAFYASLNQVVADKSFFVKSLAVIAVFLPSASFWTASLGKDSLSFMATGFALWAALNLKRRVPLMIFAILVMSLIRPHIAGIFIIALTIAFIMDKNIRLFPRMALMTISLIVAVSMVPFALKYANLKSTDKETVTKYIQKRQSYNLEGGSSLNIGSMSLPLKLYTYVFRPLPYEARSVPALLSSFDNLFLLFLFLLFMRGFYKNIIIHNDHNMIFLVSFSIATWLISAMITGNLGIAARQKWIFLPFLIFIFFSYIQYIDIGLYKHENENET